MQSVELLIRRIALLRQQFANLAPVLWANYQVDIFVLTLKQRLLRRGPAQLDCQTAEKAERYVAFAPDGDQSFRLLSDIGDWLSHPHGHQASDGIILPTLPLRPSLATYELVRTNTARCKTDDRPVQDTLGIFAARIYAQGPTNVGRPGTLVHVTM